MHAEPSHWLACLSQEGTDDWPEDTYILARKWIKRNTSGIPSISRNNLGLRSRKQEEKGSSPNGVKVFSFLIIYSRMQHVLGVRCSLFSYYPSSAIWKSEANQMSFLHALILCGTGRALLPLISVSQDMYVRGDPSIHVMQGDHTNTGTVGYEVSLFFVLKAHTSIRLTELCMGNKTERCLYMCWSCQTTPIPAARIKFRTGYF